MAQHLHVRHIKTKLKEVLDEKINLEDIAHKTAKEQEDCFLTRAQIAFCLSSITSCDYSLSSAAIVDGYKDGGMDLIYYNNSPINPILYIGQSKWKHDGNGSIDTGSVSKLIDGVKKIVNGNIDKLKNLNDRVQRKIPEIESAINNANIKIILLICYTGKDEISDEVKELLEDYMDEINDGAEFISYQVMNRHDIHKVVSTGLNIKINMEVAINEWGLIKEPYEAYYGQVAASDVAEWHSKYGNSLFSPNIRLFLGSTEVNNGIVDSLIKSPDKFWYFNNGITVLCDDLKRKVIGGTKNDCAFLTCDGFSIVNGAQTVGAISSLKNKKLKNVQIEQDEIDSKLGSARVPFRIISLKNCNEDFGKDITQKNNTQNRIDKRDFISLDPNQERIRIDMLMEGVEYKYKSGDTVSDINKQFSLDESTVALACAQDDISVVVDAKSNIGRLWDNIAKLPYTKLFNTSVNALDLWKKVLVYRKIESILSSIKDDGEGKERLVAIHGNRFITHLVFRKLDKNFFDGFDVSNKGMISFLKDNVENSYQKTCLLINELYPDSYVANIFKNQTKCSEIRDKIDG
ncbi:AIPR family protein [Pectobacterium carotovorum]|uniref:AIPR family protein n=1 Tax=Pectobacterium carotovorum TaxID=554 RepID=UPI0030164BCB